MVQECSVCDIFLFKIQVLQNNRTLVDLLKIIFCRSFVMNEDADVTQIHQDHKVRKNSRTVAIVAIISTTIVILACIFACSMVAYTFLLNAPW
jgi:hypothetical protein